MLVFESEMVVYTSYGGFSFDKEIAHWLRDNKDWKIGDAEKSENYNNQEFQLLQSYSFFYIQKHLEDSVRFNKDLIECIKTLQKLHENDSYSERRQVEANCFQIVKLKVYADAKDVHDGKEEVDVWHEEEIVDDYLDRD